MLKVAIAERLIRAVHPDADVTGFPVDIPHDAITAAIAAATVVVGCFDRETPRLVATELCSAVGVPYVDVATESGQPRQDRYTAAGSSSPTTAPVASPASTCSTARSWPANT